MVFRCCCNCFVTYELWFPYDSHSMFVFKVKSVCAFISIIYRNSGNEYKHDKKKCWFFCSVVLKIRFGYWKNIDPISVITYSHTICCKFSLTVNWSRTSFSFNFHFTREYWIWCLSNVEREKKVNVRHVVFALTCSVQIYTFYFPFPFVIKTKSHL